MHLMPSPRYPTGTAGAATKHPSPWFTCRAPQNASVMKFAHLSNET